LHSTDKFYLGNAAESSIQFDGSNLVINPRESGSGILSVLQNVDIVTDLICRSWRCDGDEGTGIANTVQGTNVVNAPNDTLAVLGNYHVGGSAGTFHGWLKFYDGTQVVWVPCWRN